MKLLVTGGTGVLGREVVRELARRNIKPRVLSRRPIVEESAEFVQGNLLEPSSLPPALEGMEVVIHLASNPNKPKEDREGTRNLLAAAKVAEVKHIVLVSIVGIDNMRWMPYYRAKLEQEHLVETGGIPHTILRAAQFHEFVAFVLASLGRGSRQFLPSGFTLQPVQTEAVAVRLVEAALTQPAGRLPDLVGPEPRTLLSLGREWLEATGRHKPVLVIPVPGFIARMWRVVGGPGAQTAGQSWSQWLAEHARQQNPYGGNAA